MIETISAKCPRCNFPFQIKFNKLHPIFQSGEIEDAEFEAMEIIYLLPPPKKKRGRPKGSKDKKPRKRRAKC
jgi:hypothetical protein